jgi:hypothetical protein
MANQNLKAYEQSLKFQKTELNEFEGQLALLKTRLNDPKTSASEYASLSFRIDEVENKAEEKRNQIASLERSIKNKKMKITRFTSRKERLDTQRDDLSSKLNNITRNRSITNNLTSKSRQRVFNRPSKFVYNDITKSMQKNTNYEEQVTAYNEKYIKDNTNEKQTLSSTKLDQKNTNKYRQNTFEQTKVNHSLNTKANQIRKIPARNLNSAQRSIQNNLNQINTYQNLIRTQTNKLTSSNKGPTRRSKIISSSKSQEIQKIADQINELKDQRREIAQIKSSFRNDQSTPSKPEDQKLSIDNNVSPEPSNVSYNSSNQIDNKVDRIQSQSIPRPQSSVNQTSTIVQNSNIETNEGTTSSSNSSSQSSDEQIVLTQDEFEALKTETPENLSNISLKEGETIAVNINGEVEVYEAQYQNGRIIGFKKTKTLSKEEALSQRIKEFKDIKELEREVVTHSNLKKLFSNILNSN